MRMCELDDYERKRNLGVEERLLFTPNIHYPAYVTSGKERQSGGWSWHILAR